MTEYVTLKFFQINTFLKASFVLRIKTNKTFKVDQIKPFKIKMKEYQD